MLNRRIFTLALAALIGVSSLAVQAQERPDLRIAVQSNSAGQEPAGEVTNPSMRNHFPIHEMLIKPDIYGDFSLQPNLATSWEWISPTVFEVKLRTDVVSPGFAGGLPHQARFDYSYDGAMRAFEQSLLRLGLDRIDILLIHDCDVWTHGPDVDRRFGEAMDGAYRALARLREEGAVRAIGAGINEAEMCVRFAEAGDFDVMMMAGRYSLLQQQSLQTFLPLAQRKGIGIMLAGVFNSGILATGAVPGARYDYREAPPDVMDKVRRMEKVCAAHGVTIREAAMHFPLGHPAVSALVLGGVTPDEVRANVASFAVPIPTGLWSDLKTEGLIAPDVPTP